jgi:hypothetical protein
MSQWGRLRLVFMGWGCGEESENFLVVVVAGEETGGCDKDERLGKILERERKKSLTEKIAISVSLFTWI